MSEYSFYVWTAYGVSLLAIAAAIVWTVLAHARARAALSALERRAP